MPLIADSPKHYPLCVCDCSITVPFHTSGYCLAVDQNAVFVRLLRHVIFSIN
jgi:hypothetical protein